MHSSSSPTPLRRRGLVLLVAAACAAGMAPRAGAGPTSPQVVAGQASFSQQGNVFSITSTPNTIINWASFSVNQGEIARFIQQSDSSAVLNRITGQDPTRILGALQSNGKVFLINPNGVLFGAGSQVDVKGLVASSLNISNADFLAGKLSFNGAANAGAVVNQGAITTPGGGQVFLIAPNVSNSGIIQSPQGEVILAAGHSVQLADSGNPDLHVVVSAPADQALNLGQVIAQGGRIGIYGALLNQRGIVSADSAVVGVNGKVVLKSSGTTLLGAGSRTSASGAGTGGTVELLGARVGLEGDARVDASGAAGGGAVLLGGGVHGADAALPNAQAVYVSPDAVVAADATGSGNGGTVAVWSDQATRMFGSISARGAAGGNGGFVETSGHYLALDGARVDTRAPAGKTGQWLLDPYDIDVVASGGSVSLSDVASFDAGSPTGTSAINAALISGATSNVTLQATDNITFSSAVNIVAAGVGLNAQAGNAINVAAPVATHGGALTLQAGGAAGLTTLASLDAGGGAVTLTADSMRLGATVSGNSVTLAPFSPSQRIALGEAGSAGTLGLLQSDLNRLNTGVVTIEGNNGGGDFAVSSAVSFPNTVQYLTLSTHGNMQINGALGMQAGTATLYADVFDDSKAFSIASGASVTARTIGLQASTMNLGGGVNGSAGVSLTPYLSNDSVDIGGTGGAGVLGLSQVSLANVSTPALTVIGYAGINVSAPVTLNQNSVSLISGAALTIANGASLAGKTVSLQSDSIGLGGALNASVGANIAPYTSGRAIALGGSGSGALVLGAADLNNIVTPLLQIGGEAGGAIDINGAVNLGAGVQNLNLLSGGAVGLHADLSLAHAGGALTVYGSALNQDAGALSVPVLNVSASGAVRLTGADNNIGTATASAASIAINSSGNLSIGAAGLALSGSDAEGAIAVSAGGQLAVNGDVQAGTGDVTLSGASIAAGTGMGAAQQIAIGGNNVTLTATTAGTGAIHLGNVAISGGNVVLQADQMGFDGASAISAGAGGSVLLAPLTNTNAIVLGAGATDAAGTLGLSDTELKKISAGTLLIGSGVAPGTDDDRIGGIYTGNINVAGALDLSSGGRLHALAITSNAGDISVNGALAAPSLTLGAGGTLTNNATIRSDTMTLVAGHALFGNGSGQGITATGALHIAPVGDGLVLGGAGGDELGLSSDSLASISTPLLMLDPAGPVTFAGPLILPANKIGNFYLSSNQSITQGAGQGISGPSLLTVFAPSVALAGGNSVGAISGAASEGGFSFNSIGKLVVGGSSGNGGVQGISAEESIALSTSSAQGISQNAGAVLATPQLQLQSAGPVTLAEANAVGGVQGDLTAASGAPAGGLILNSTNTLVVGTLTTHGRNIDLSSNNGLYIEGQVDAGAGSVKLAGDSMILENTVGAAAVSLRPFSDGRQIAIGGACPGGEGSCLALSSLRNIVAPSVAIGSASSGAIGVGGDLGAGSGNLNAATNRLALLSGGTVSQAQGSAITVRDLAVSAVGNLTLDGPNHVQNIAATLNSDGAGLVLSSNDALTVAHLGDSALGYDIAGLSNTNGDIALTSALGIAQGAGAKTVARSLTLSAGGGIGSAAAPLLTQVAALSAVNTPASGGAAPISIRNNADAPGQLTLTGAQQLGNNNSGAVSIENTGPFLLPGGATVSTASGDIGLVAHSPLTIDGTVHSTSGNITLTAGATGSAADVLTVGSLAQVSTDHGNIALSAGGIIDIAGGAQVSAPNGRVTQAASQNTPPVTAPTLAQCVANPALAGCAAVLPTLPACVANPGTAGCSAVLPTLPVCLADPSIAGCSAVLPTLPVCIANPSLPGCAVVLPALPVCVANPGTAGCSAVLPTLPACVASPSTAGCSAVLPTLPVCVSNPTTAGCSAVLPSLPVCVANPATAGCAAVLPPLAVCLANPAAAGCSAVLPTLAACVANPAAPGCSSVLPTLAQCVANPSLAGCAAVLPTLSACSANPGMAGCSAVLPSLGQCTAAPSLQGCGAVLPTLAQCSANPAAAGCSAVLPTLAQCAANPSAAGCAAILPTLAQCVANPSLAGCSAVLPTLAQCAANPSLTGCAATSPTGPVIPPAGASQDQCALTPSLALCQVLTPPTQSTPVKPVTTALNSTVDLTLPNAPGKNGSTATGGTSGGNDTTSSGSASVAATPNSGVNSNEPAKKTYCN